MIDSSLLMIKFTVAFYTILVFIEDKNMDRRFFVVSILIYLLLSLINSLTEEIKIKKAINFITIVLIYIGYNNGFTVFILLIPICFYEILEIRKINIIYGVLLNIFTLFIIDITFYKEFILIVVSSYFFISNYIQHSNKKTYYEEEIYKLKKDINKLNSKLTRNHDHQENLRYLAKLEERNSIAQSIHDNIGHVLSGSLMQLEAVKMLIKIDDKKAEEMVGQVIEVLREGMNNIRSTLKNIKPKKEDIGINRLKVMLEDFENKSNIRIIFDYDDYEIKRISFYEWRLIFDSLREIMTNTIKYSKADKLNVEIKRLNKFLRISTKDNGLGCSNITKGLGLRGIEERTENAGGKVIIDGSNGFAVIILIPIKEES